VADPEREEATAGSALDEYFGNQESAENEASSARAAGSELAAQPAEAEAPDGWGATEDPLAAPLPEDEPAAQAPDAWGAGESQPEEQGGAAWDAALVEREPADAAPAQEAHPDQAQAETAKVADDANPWGESASEQTDPEMGAPLHFPADEPVAVVESPWGAEPDEGNAPTDGTLGASEESPEQGIARPAPVAWVDHNAEEASPEVYLETAPDASPEASLPAGFAEEPMQGEPERQAEAAHEESPWGAAGAAQPEQGDLLQGWVAPPAEQSPEGAGWIGEALAATTPLGPADLDTLAEVGVDPNDGVAALRLLAGLLRALSRQSILDLGALAQDLHESRAQGAAALAAAEREAAATDAGHPADQAPHEEPESPGDEPGPAGH